VENLTQNQLKALVTVGTSGKSNLESSLWKGIPSIQDLFKETCAKVSEHQSTVVTNMKTNAPAMQYKWTTRQRQLGVPQESTIHLKTLQQNTVTPHLTPLLISQMLCILSASIFLTLYDKKHCDRRKVS
jgi:hypothetical protein